jgi:anti-sigma regulatory factor (Ser/Thr protein kinase)
MSCPESLAVEVRDEGPPFDADAVDDPDPAKMRDHGMGIYLMRQAMDVVEFRSGCPGNMVRMIKWLDPGKRSTEPQ